MAQKNVILIILLVSLLFTISCKTKHNGGESICKKYKVVKVDSISDVYVIHALNQGKYFKIVSQKEEQNFGKCHSKIKVGKEYKLELKSLFLNKEKLPLIVEGIEFYGQTIDIEKDSIYDIHSATNLKGLCLIKE